MENLAEGQGGNGPSTSSAHAQQEAKMAKFLARGEEILGTFTSSIRAFESQTLNIKTLTESVAELKKDLSRKRPGDSADTGITAKVAKPVNETESRSTVPDLDDEIEDLMNSAETNEVDAEVEFLQDVSDFFAEELETGEAISEKVANLVNRSIRGQTDEGKVKQLKEKYKRPSNVENLQVPTVDKILWDQLKWQTKGSDAIRQKAIGRLHEGIMPMMQAMDHVANTKQVDVALLKTYITDTFKILCNNVIKTNAERRENIKKELSPKFKGVCKTPVSATGLFGDSLAEDIKKLETRAVNLTSKVPFLGKPGVAGPSQQFRRPQYRRPQHHYPHKPTFQKPMYQNHPGKFGSFRSGKHSEKSGIPKNKWDK